PAARTTRPRFARASTRFNHRLPSRLVTTPGRARLAPGALSLWERAGVRARPQPKPSPYPRFARFNQLPEGEVKNSTILPLRCPGASSGELLGQDQPVGRLRRRGDEQVGEAGQDG